jgi:predicted lipoprotein with Yx(FWY)xxD motif
LAAVAVSVVTVGSCGGSSAARDPALGTLPLAAAAPGEAFSAARVAGVGSVVVDGHGRTVYVLTSSSAGPKNLNCDLASGCTAFWPALPLPSGTAAAAGPGVDQSKLSMVTLSDGESYPTYNGWLMYEFINDTAAGQAHGEGVMSFGGTWYALSPSGTPVLSPAGASTTAAAVE